MSLHRALAEIKLLDSRIQKEIYNSTFIDINKVENKLIKSMSIQDYKDKVLKSSFMSVLDMMTRRDDIKRALVKANAETVFDFNGEKMSIAEAIDRKNTIQVMEEFICELANQYSNAVQKVETSNNTLQKEATEQAVRVFGDKEKVDVEQFKAFEEAYIKTRRLEVLDPNQLVDNLAVMRAEMEDFKNNIDFKLSEVNATTFIEV